MTVFVHGRACTTACGEDPQRPEHLSAGLWRRTSRLGRWAIGVAEQALRQAKLEPSVEVALIVGTGLADLSETLAFIDSAHDRAETLASPVAFQRSVHSAVAGELAIALGLRGFNLTVTGGKQSAQQVLDSARVALSAGRCSSCLCVIADGLGPEPRERLLNVRPDERAAEGAAAVVLALSDEGALGPLPVLPDPQDLGAYAVDALAAVVNAFGGAESAPC